MSARCCSADAGTGRGRQGGRVPVHAHGRGRFFMVLFTIFSMSLFTYLEVSVDMALMRRNQRTGDRSPRAYTLAFPRELDEDRVVAWLRSISGTLRASSVALGASPAIGFELISDAAGLTYRIKVPSRHAAYVIGELRSHVPGIRVTPEEDQPDTAWTRAVEVGLSGSERPLRIFSVPDVSTSVLASVQGLRGGEAVLVQWVMTPAIPVHPPRYRARRGDELRLEHLYMRDTENRDEITDRRKKLAEPNFLAVLRVAAAATTETKADDLIARVRNALASTRSASVHFTRRFVTGNALRQRIDQAAGSFAYPIQLSVPEAAALIAWPVGEPHMAGLPQSRSRHLPPSSAIARKELVVAKANFPGAERPLAISPVDACKHVHIVGPIGVGKTALAGNLAVQAMAAGSGVIVMESKGDLFRLVLDAVPRDRLDDVIVLDVGDERPVGYNLLGEGNPRIAVEEICQLFEYLYPDMRRGIWARAALHRGLSTLITRPGMTFVDLVPLLSPGSRSEVEREWRDELVAGVTDPELARFWQRFDDLTPQQQEAYAAPVLDRVWQLNERPEIRNVIGQSESSFLMRQAIRERKVLLINLAGLGVETGRLAGTLLLNAIWSAVRSGVADQARPMYLFLDEFQDFLNLPVDPETMLVQARSFGLAMALAHQHLDQLPGTIRSAVLANARNKVVFQTTADDARVFAREFGRSVSEDDFMELGQYEVLCRLVTSEGVSAPVSATTLLPPEPTERAAEVRNRARERYGRSLADIQADIERRRTPRSPQPKKRPRLGGTAWDE